MTVERPNLVLAYPNQRWHKDDIQTVWNLNPSTLCLLAAAVQDDVNVEIVDAQFYDLSVEQFVDRVEQANPSYIGISILSTEYKETLHTAVAALKERLPDPVVIVGGVHVTIEYEDVMSDLGIDYAVIGDGEYVLRDLLRHLEGHGEMPLVGLAYRDGENLVALQRAVIDDLDALPMPNYDLVRMEDYVAESPRVGPNRPPEMPYVRLVITRGCPVGCSFCQVESISGKRVRSPSAKKVVDELIYLRDRYGVKSFLIDDDNIVIKKKFFKELLRELSEREAGLSFLINAFAIFKLDDEMLNLMVQAGCVGINVAIESGNQRVMNDIVLKPLDLKTVPPLMKKVHDAGLFVIANFIIGFPGESWAEIRETIHYAEHCGADYVKFFVAVPLRGTQMWDIALEIGAITDEVGSGSSWRFSQITSDEWTSNDVSVLRAYEWDRVNFATLEKRRNLAALWGVSEEEMEDLRKKTRNSVTASDLGADLEATPRTPALKTPAQRWTDPGSATVVGTPVRIGLSS